MKSCGIYFRGNDIYVLTSSKTTIGIWIDTEPRFKLNVTDSAEPLGEAVLTALDASREGLPTPENLRSVAKNLLKFAGVKTLAAFEKGAIYFSIERKGNGVRIVPSTRAKRGGFLHQPDQAVKCEPQPKEIGEALFNLAAAESSGA